MIAIQIITRLYPGEDDDLLEWYAGQGDHYGARSHAIKQALRRGIAAANVPLPSPPLGGIEGGELRDIVEAAVVTAMNRYSVAAITGDDEADEKEQLLNDLGKALILET